MALFCGGHYLFMLLPVVALVRELICTTDNMFGNTQHKLVSPPEDECVSSSFQSIFDKRK
jgi:hypothetical protein